MKRGETKNDQRQSTRRFPRKAKRVRQADRAARRAQRGSLLRRRARGNKLWTRRHPDGVDGPVAARGRRGVRGGGAYRAQGRHGTARRGHGTVLGRRVTNAYIPSASSHTRSCPLVARALPIEGGGRQ